MDQDFASEPGVERFGHTGGGLSGLLDNKDLNWMLSDDLNFSATRQRNLFASNVPSHAEPQPEIASLDRTAQPIRHS